MRSGVVSNSHSNFPSCPVLLFVVSFLLIPSLSACSCFSSYSSSPILSTSISSTFPPPFLLSTSPPPLPPCTSSFPQLDIPSANAHPSICDSDIWRPLHYACDNGHVECVRAITSYPSHHLGLYGLQPAIDLAERGGHKEIVAILRDAYDRFVSSCVLFSVHVALHICMYSLVLEQCCFCYTR